MHVSVAIVTYRNKDDALRCLRSLERSTYRDFSVIVCENGGTQAFSEMVAALPKSLSTGQSVRVVAEPSNPGFAGGVNRCIAETGDAPSWWILNPDTSPDPDALAQLVSRLALGDVEATGGVLYGDNGRVQSYAGHWNGLLGRTASIGLGSALTDVPDHAVVEDDISYIVGASMLVSAQFVQKAGLMREDYFLYGEEVEWCLRAKARGARLGFAPGARVLHYHGTTTGASGDLRGLSWVPVYLNERNKLLLVRDTKPWLLPFSASLSLGLLAARYLRRRAWRQFGYGVSGWSAGLFGRRGKPDRLIETESA